MHILELWDVIPFVCVSRVMFVVLTITHLVFLFKINGAAWLLIDYWWPPFTVSLMFLQYIPGACICKMMWRDVKQIDKHPDPSPKVVEWCVQVRSFFLSALYDLYVLLNVLVTHPIWVCLTYISGCKWRRQCVPTTLHWFIHSAHAVWFWLMAWSWIWL